MHIDQFNLIGFICWSIDLPLYIYFNFLIVCFVDVLFSFVVLMIVRPACGDIFLTVKKSDLFSRSMIVSLCYSTYIDKFIELKLKYLTNC
jgi:hypothetical protein